MSDDALLATVEQRVRDLVTTGLRQITGRYRTVLTAAITANPTGSGAEITGDPAVHKALVDVLAATRARVEAAIRAGYAAAARAGTVAAGTEAAALHLDPGPVTVDPAALDAVLRDVAAAVDTARLDLVDSVRAAQDGVSGAQAAPARILVTGQATDRAVRRLGVRLRGAATVAVHRGYTDAQSAVYRALVAAQPTLGLRKRWEVRSANPCPTCAALHGATVALDEHFDPAAGSTAGYRPPPVWQALTGPPRHPNCRCRLVADTTQPVTTV